MSLRDGLAALLCAAALSLSGGAAMSAETRTFAYVGNADSGDITVLALSPDGALATLDTTPVPGAGAPASSMPLAVSPDRSRLYAVVRVEPFAVVSFDIDSNTGRLSLLGAGALADSMAYISTDRTGRTLFAASYGGSKFSTNPIGADGVVAPPQQVEATGPNAHAILPDPTNRYVLVTSLGGNLVHQLTFDATTGQLSPNTPPAAPIPTGSGPRHLVFSPDQRFVYVLGELDATVHVLPWDAGTGTLGAAIQSVSALPADFTGKPWSADIHVTPDGRFLYASERTGSTLAAFRIDVTDGRLSLIGTYPTETQPRGFAIDPSSRYLLAAGQLSSRLSCYAIDQATGALSKLSDTAVGRNPNWVEILTLP